MFRPAPFLVTVLDRVKAIVRRVARPMEGRMRIARLDAAKLAPVQGPISPVMRGVVKSWLSAKLRALSALMERIRAGETVDPPVSASFARRTAVASAVREVVPPEERLPTGFGWMCGFGPNVRRDGAAFAAWLNEPAMQAMVLAAPVKMAGLIGPILTATGQSRPEWFQGMPKRARKNFLASGGGRPERQVDGAEAGEVPDIASGYVEEAAGKAGSREVVPPADGCFRINPPTTGERLCHLPSGLSNRTRLKIDARRAGFGFGSVVQGHCFKKDIVGALHSLAYFVTISK
jgi:hypothetical protein